jgi:hypothetical protein
MAVMYRFSPLGQRYAVVSKDYLDSAFKLIGTNTLKKRLAKAIFRTLVALKLKILGLSVVNDIKLNNDFSINEVLDFILNTHRLKLSVVLIIWNREFYRGRIYIWLFDPENNKMYFLKVGSGEDDAERFECEYTSLQSLIKKDRGYEIPQPIFLGNYEGSSLLLVSAIPKIEYTHIPAKIFNEKYFKGYTVSRAKVDAEAILSSYWFNDFKGNESYELSMLFESSLDNYKYFELGFCHGDLGSENSFLLEGKLWVIDWEHSGYELPWMIDYVALLVSREKSLSHVYKSLEKTFFINPEDYKGDLLLALAFLVSRKFNMARSFLLDLLDEEEVTL